MISPGWRDPMSLTRSPTFAGEAMSEAQAAADEAVTEASTAREAADRACAEAEARADAADRAAAEAREETARALRASNQAKEAAAEALESDFEVVPSSAGDLMEIVGAKYRASLPPARTG